MMEQNANQFESGNGRKVEKIKESIALAIELSESREVFDFPGIDPKAYEKLRSVDEEYPGYVTPIQELKERMEKEGIKVVLSGDNIFIVPAGCDESDVEKNSIFPRHLQITDNLDNRVKRLILLTRRDDQ